MADHRIARIAENFVWDEPFAQNSGQPTGGRIQLFEELLGKHVSNRAEFETAIYWEGNYWDENVHDCAEAEWSTAALLFRKIGNMLRSRGIGKGDRLLVAMPNMVQGPLIVMAAASVGAVCTLIKGTESPRQLAKILEVVEPKLLICVDAFWQGDQLFELKSTIDEALGQKIVVVLRHVGPNPGMPPPEKHIPARRPYYKIEVSMKEGRDYDWSDQFVKQSDDFSPEPYAADQFVCEFVKWADYPKLVPLTVSQLLQDVLELGSHLKSAPGISELQHAGHLCLGDLCSHFGLTAFFAILHRGLPPIIFEGTIDYPDPSRVAHIIAKYKAVSLLASGDFQLDAQYMGFVSNASLKVVISAAKQKQRNSKIFPSATHHLHAILGAEKVSKEYEPPEWAKDEDDPIAASVFCWGAVLKQAGSELIAQAELFSLVNILSVPLIGTRPTPQRMAQMARNQLKGQDARDIVQDIYLEVMGDEDENQLTDSDISERDLEPDAPRSRASSRGFDIDSDLEEARRAHNEPTIVITDMDPVSPSTAETSAGTPSFVKKAVISRTMDFSTEDEDGDGERSSAESSDEELGKKPVPKHNPFDDDFVSEPKLERKEETVVTTTHYASSSMTKVAEPVNDNNPFDSDEEELQSPFNQSTLSGRDPFEHLKGRRTHKFSSGSDDIVHAHLSDDDLESSTRSNQKDYFLEIEKEMRDKEAPSLSSIAEVPTPKAPPRSQNKASSARGGPNSSPEPLKKPVIKKAVPEEAPKTRGLFTKNPRSRGERRNTNPFDDDDAEEEASSSDSDVDERPAANNRRSPFGAQQTTPTPPGRKNIPKTLELNPPKELDLEEKQEEQEVSENPSHPREAQESIDDIFKKEIQKRRESHLPVIGVVEGRGTPPSVRDSPHLSGFQRKNSLTPGRVSRRSTQRRRVGKTRSEPEFVDRKSQPAFRLKAPTTKKKKMVLHRVEQTDVMVELLNGQKIEVSCRSDVLTADVFSLVVGHMNINEHVFFGLSVLRDGEHFFLDDEQRLEKFAPSGWKDRTRRVGYTLHLRFRFYPQILEFIKTDVTLHELYLQLRRDILEDRLQPKKDKAYELAALALQVEFGDRPPPAVKDYFAMEYYLQRRFYQFDDEKAVQTEIGQRHEKYRGLRAKEAETRYIQVCTCLPDYGAHLHRVFRSKPSTAHGASPFDPDTGANMWIAIMPKGIIVLEEQAGVRHSLAEHVWQCTQTLQFDKKRFVIVAQRNGEPSETVFWTDHYSKSAYFVRFAASQHRFMMRMRQWKNTLKTERSLSTLPDVAAEGSLPRRNHQSRDSAEDFRSPPHQPTPSSDEAENRPPPGATFTATLQKDPSSGLGLTLIPGVYVKSMAPGGVGEKSGLLVGDRLLAVNGISLVSADRHRAVDLVKASGSTVRIDVSRLEGVAAHARQFSADSTGSKPQNNGHHNGLGAPNSSGTRAQSRTPPAPRKQPNKRQRAVSDFGAFGDQLPVLNSDDIIADKMRAISGLHLDESDEEKGEYRLPPHTIYSYDNTDEDTLGGSSRGQRQAQIEEFAPEKYTPPAREPRKYQQHRRSNLDWTEELDEAGEDDDLIHVELVRNSAGSLGIQIASQAGRVCIKQVTAEPGLSANVKPMDVLVAVDGVSAINRTHQEVVNMLRTAGQVVQLTLRREEKQGQTDDDDSDEDEKTIRVTLDKGEGGSLGLSLAKRTGFDGIFIRTIGPDSAAEKEATLRVGDRMWAIDGEEVGTASPAALVEKLKQVRGPVHIVVKRPKNMA
ncbi:unnamed protein product, partial [Mesorhabditis spiculigera]